MPRDAILVDDPRIFDSKVLILLRHDKVIELYARDDSGHEQYAGRLEHGLKADEVKVQRLVRAIRERVVERPFSRTALHWLDGLSYTGMLARWEDRGG